jgi:hypothetical protein
VFAPRSKALGFTGTLNNVKKEDIGWKEFHWVTLVLLFFLATGGGMALMWWESDKPLRGLMIDAVALGKGETAKLDEMKHRGRFGSIARSVNIALEKLAREAKASRKDLGAVLGPPPDDGILGGGARPLPSPLGGGGSPFAPPAPADFSFEPPSANPVPSAPMHLGPPAVASGRSAAAEPAAPSGRGFDFDMPPVPAVPPPAQRMPPPSRPTTSALPPLPPIPPSSAGSGARPTRPATAAAPPPRPAAPPPPPSIPAPPVPRLPTASIPVVRPSMPAVPSLDDDILAPNLDDDMMHGEGTGVGASARGDFGGATVVADPSEDLLRQAADGGEATYFREVFEDFVELKRKCGESIDNLTYDKFSAKLRANRDALIAKYHCKAVKFQVYVKDGKAALKATPVKT